MKILDLPAEPWVLIGCPVYQREWILREWFESIIDQDFPLDRIGFVFVASPEDKPTIELLMDFRDTHPELRCFEILIDESGGDKDHPEGGRLWSYERYHKMVYLRNLLLNEVCRLSPDRYFSLDSDILLEDTHTIQGLIDVTEVPAIGAANALCFMTPNDLNFPSVMTWRENSPNIGFREHPYPLGHVFQADIIMAAVMMTPEVYTLVRYEFHPQGEDLGWSVQCQQHGFKLFCASHLYAVHVMSRGALLECMTGNDPRKSQLSSLGYYSLSSPSGILMKRTYESSQG